MRINEMEKDDKRGFVVNSDEVIGNNIFQLIYDGVSTSIYEEGKKYSGKVYTKDISKELEGNLKIDESTSVKMNLHVDEKDYVTKCNVCFSFYNQKGDIENTLILKIDDISACLTLQNSDGEVLREYYNILEFDYPLTYSGVDDVVKQLVFEILKDKDNIIECRELSIMARHLGDVEPELVNYINENIETNPNLEELLITYVTDYYKRNDVEYKKIRKINS